MLKVGSLRPCLRRVSWLPGESLPSLLARLMLANRYDPPRLFTGFCTQRLASLGIRDSLGCPTQPQTFEILATLTGTTVEQLASASIHRFAPMMNLTSTNHTVILPNGQPLLLIGKNLRDDLRSEDDVQYCPLCLAEAAYHRLCWFPKAVAICLSHRCFLLEDCWQCGKRLNIMDLVKRSCEACCADLAIAPSIPIQDDSFGVFVQEAISSWLGLSSLMLSSEWGLPDHPSHVLWRILFGLYSSLENRMDWSYLYWLDMLPKEAEPARNGSKRYLKPACSYVLHATAFKGLVDWPKGFHDFLGEYRAYTMRHYRHFDSVGLEDLAYRWLEYQWRSPEFAFVQEAYRQFIQRIENGLTSPTNHPPKRPELSRRFKYMTVERAADELHVNENIIYRLIRAGKLTSLDSKASLPVWVSRRDVALIFDSWRQCLSPDRAGRALGIPPEAVIDLARMGFFITERGPIAADGSEDWLFNWQSAIDFMDNETFNLPVMNEFDQYRLDLISASQYMEGFGVTVASLIAGVVTGTLRAFREDEFDERFDQWIFLGDDLDQLAQMIIEENQWVGQAEIINSLKISPVTVKRWLERGLLEPVARCNNYPFFGRKQMEEFMREYVFREEAIRILGISSKALTKWIQNGRLKLVSGREVDGCRRYLFHRKDLERLSPCPQVDSAPGAEAVGDHECTT